MPVKRPCDFFCWKREPFSAAHLSSKSHSQTLHINAACPRQAALIFLQAIQEKNDG
jgi:hypothetical protein